MGRFINLQLPFFHKSEEECENDFPEIISRVIGLSLETIETL